MELVTDQNLYKSCQEAKEDLIEILSIPKNYEILFLQGGATFQFSMIPMNFKHLTGTADYVTTGSWTKKAILKRAQR